jgi:hypothetical protein
MQPFTNECRCAYCRAGIEPAEARAAAEILAHLAEEVFWEVTDALGPPEAELAVLHPFGVRYDACLECVTQALFSLILAPGGHCML